ncbi:PTS sugar transporter subunit IIA [Companilactobacillus sp. HBUAS59544]|jgi:mannose/fructose-specific phosphotransferase system component IIA|uniref:PTS sugar transporter subunit IIA n=1 Tax=Companilactobacillus sp. HBUAS59544 TaxID=3109363 RepID=UPI002FF0A91A
MSDKYQVILISHNKLAEGILSAAKMIAGDQIEAKAYGLMPGENPQDKVKQIEKELDPEAHTLILADLFGGSMANAAIPLSVKDNVRLITGLNLALALQVILEHPWSDAEIEKTIGRAQENIQEVKVDAKADEDESFF